MTGCCRDCHCALCDVIGGCPLCHVCQTCAPLEQHLEPHPERRIALYSPLVPALGCDELSHVEAEALAAGIRQLPRYDVLGVERIASALRNVVEVRDRTTGARLAVYSRAHWTAIRRALEGAYTDGGTARTAADYAAEARVLLDRLGLSQRAAARRVGLRRTELWHVVHGSCSATTAQRVWTALRALPEAAQDGEAATGNG